MIGMRTGKPSNGGYSLYSATPATLVSKIPASMSFTDACVLPVSISTASAALYRADTLGLPYPSRSQSASGKLLVVWGGASSVGSSALQLAKASGVATIATASTRNHEYCRSVGASQVIGYSSSSVVQDVVDAILASGQEFVGIFDSITTPETTAICLEILGKTDGGKKLIRVQPAPKDVPEGIVVEGVVSLAINFEYKEVGAAVWGSYVGTALEGGSLRPLPKAKVVGEGLEVVQKALGVQKSGVSARKIVVEL